MGGVRLRDPRGRGRRRHHDRRHAAELDPAHRRPRRPGREARAARGRVPRGRRLLGRRRARGRSAASALHDAGVRGFKCFLADSGRARVPAAVARRARRGARRGGRARRAAARPRRGRRPSPTPPARRRTSLRRLRRLAAARGRGPRDRGVLEGAARPAPGSTCSTCPAPRRCPDRGRPAAAGSRSASETCPHYLTFTRRGGPGRARRSSSAARRSASRRTATAVEGLRRRHDRLRRLRPLTVHRRTSSTSTPATSAPHGAGSRRCSSGCRLVWTEARRARVRALRRRRLDVARPRPTWPGSPARALAPGRDADLVSFAPDKRLVVDPAGSTTATP